MNLCRGAGVDVERDAELLERFLVELVVAVNDHLGGDALLAGLEGDGYAVFVGAAYVDHILPFQPQVAGVDVGRDVYAGQMADMDGAVGIGQGRSDQVSFKSGHDRFVTVLLTECKDREYRISNKE